MLSELVIDTDTERQAWPCNLPLLSCTGSEALCPRMCTGRGVAPECPMGQRWEGDSATQALPWLLMEVHPAWGGQ